MSETPLFSVVTPSYNQARFIEETIESVRRQTYDEIEHIVVDGESNDGTLNILRQYDDLTWISEPDEGQSDAINKGFDMATGAYIGWLNSDDVFFDTSVCARVVKYFEQTGADVIYGDIALIDADSRLLKFHCVPSFSMAKLRRYCFIEQPALFFDADVLADNRLDTDLEYVMDYEFWLRLASEYEFRHVSDVLAADRNHPDRKILGQRDAMQAEARQLQQQYGTSFDRSFRFGRLFEALTSGLPRRGRAIQTTLQFLRDPPELAFDGEPRPTGELLTNVARPNRTLV
jgi:glycosyltransferase involved in cell wall biosynthesis